MSPNLNVNVGNLTFPNPILAASGTFGYGLEFADLIDLNSLGGFVTKGLSLHPRGGNPSPRIHETACGMLNSIGLHNIGVDAFINEKLPRLRDYNTRVIANVYGETPADFVAVAKKLDQAEGLSGLEINVSCPNVKKGGLDLGTDPSSVLELVRSIREVTSLPLWTKLTPNVTDILSLAQAAVEGGANAVVLINSVKGMALDWRKATPHLHTTLGGLSGPAIKPIALGKVFEVAKNMDVPIVGVGGISSAEDVLEFIVTGASAVEIGTQNFVHPHSSQTIAQELGALLEKEKISSIETLHRNLYKKNNGAA